MVKQGRERFDWQQTHARIARALASGGERSAAESERIFAERARSLALPLRADESAVRSVEVVVFTIGAERYGVEASFVVEVTPLRGLTSIPQTPAFLAGVLLHRGRVVPVLDLRRLLELPGGAASQAMYAVVLEVGAMTFAVVAEELIGVLRISERELKQHSAARSDRPTLVRALTPAAAIVDVEALAADPRIIVDDGAGRQRDAVHPRGGASASEELGPAATPGATGNATGGGGVWGAEPHRR